MQKVTSNIFKLSRKRMVLLLSFLMIVMVTYANDEKEVIRYTTTSNPALAQGLNGSISEGFDAKKNHLAVDIVAKKNSAVKATADGTVIFSGWTTETGYVIILKHAYDYISVYKHNGNLLKEQGDFVKSGEVIASVGSSGELTTGPHLHFELWSGGYAINPINLIDFK